jgi:hypothetical protein
LSKSPELSVTTSIWREVRNSARPSVITKFTDVSFFIIAEFRLFAL